MALHCLYKYPPNPPSHIHPTPVTASLRLRLKNKNPVVSLSLSLSLSLSQASISKVSGCTMRNSLLMCSQTHFSLSRLLYLPPKEKAIVVMGATATGKSRLSIDLATRFPAEIINSDKMQLYKGLNIVTNKVTEQERKYIPHHLLSILNPDKNITAYEFTDLALLAIESTLSRGKVPIIVGGSNSYIEALVDSSPTDFKYCFLWVDVSMPVLRRIISGRVDRMIESGMVNEVANVFIPNEDYSQGIKRAIGLQELDKYIRTLPFSNEKTRDYLLEKAILEIKDNTFKLAKRQVEKIHRLCHKKGWKVYRLDTTNVFGKSRREAEEEWEENVVEPATTIIDKFLWDGVTSNKSRAAIIRPP